MHSDDEYIQIPSLRSQIPSFKVMDVLAMAELLEAQGNHVCHMEVGQPSTGAPQQVIEAAQLALTQEKIGYTHSMGISSLREAIAKHYVKKYKVLISPANIVITTGSSAAFLFCFMGCFNANDYVGLCSSGYPCYRNILSSLEVNYVCIPANNEFKVTANELMSCIIYRRENNMKPLKGLILSSPSNPTGAMLSAEELKALCDVCKEYNILFLSDEIYHGITYDNKVEATALEFSKDVIVINSFSKYYSMTGWRLGWMIVPDYYIDTMNRLSQNLYINAPTLSQIAAVKAFECDDELKLHVIKYSSNRKIVLDALFELGFEKTSISPADGAFYIYVDLSNAPGIVDPTQLNTPKLCEQLLIEAKVAITPGIDFEDPTLDLGLRRIRFSYSRNTQEVQEGMLRFQTWWRKTFPV